MANWKYSVGEVFVSNEAECFWMFPTEFFCNRKLSITSPWFSLEDEKWRLVKTPGSTSENYVSLYLWKKVRSSPPSHTYHFELNFKSVDNRTTLDSWSGTVNSDFGLMRQDFFDISTLGYYGASCCGLMKLTFVLRIKEVIHSSVTSITTALEENESKSDEEHEENEEPGAKGIQRLAQNLKQLFHDGQNSDAILEADNQEFPVHKAILSARSPVFASMFQHDMVEKNSGVVNIPDCTAESFKVFLLYLYTGVAEAMSPSNVFNVYYAADKYRVDDLREECVEYMEEILSVETFCDVIALSLRHGESKLQKVATRFFRENIKEIIKTVQWQKYLSENSIHANELLIKALNA